MDMVSRVISTAAGVIFIIALPLFLTATMLRIEFNFAPLYYSSFTRNDVPATTGIELEELKGAADRLIDYFNHRADSPQMTVVKDGTPVLLFNERELIHLEDVRELLLLDYRIQNITLLALFLSTLGLVMLRRERGRAALGGAMFAGGILTLTLAGLLVIGVLAAFRELFYLFHVVSFDNLFWQLDPARDHLIMMFPEPFWYMSIVAAMAGIVAGAVAFSVAGWFLRRSGGPVASYHPI